jgi:hypothetical protein
MASIVYFDINSLKQINDGNPAGDTGCCRWRRFSSPMCATPMWWGASAAATWACSWLQTDQGLAEQKAIAAEPLHWQGHDIRLGVAFGVYSFTGGENVGEAINAADRAIYAAKHRRPGSSGRGLIVSLFRR